MILYLATLSASASVSRTILLRIRASKSSNRPSNSRSGTTLSVAKIVFIVLGGLVGLLAIAITVYLCIYRRRKSVVAAAPLQDLSGRPRVPGGGYAISPLQGLTGRLKVPSGGYELPPLQELPGAPVVPGEGYEIPPRQVGPVWYEELGGYYAPGRSENPRPH